VDGKQVPAEVVTPPGNTGPYNSGDLAGAAAVLLASSCDTAQQVPWASYSTSLQTRIDAATATGNCAALQALLTAAKNTSHEHEKATGFPNDALVSYIEAAQARAGCPTGND